MMKIKFWLYLLIQISVGTGVLLMLITGCQKKDLPATVPFVYTIVATDITTTSANIGGNIVLDGGKAVTARGVCWSINSNPTIALSTKTSDSIGSGSFTSRLTGLTASKPYYVRAYATNSAGTAYGNEVLFATIGERVTDIDGNIYLTAAIGTQIWMAENLKTTRYRDGSPIPNITDNFEWGRLTTGAYSWYNNDAETYKKTYGALYNWYAVVDSRNICPIGWHAPTDAEWIILETNLAATSGGKMKEKGTAHWIAPNTGATNESAFSALPGGFRSYSGDPFGNLGGDGYYHSATAFDATTMWARYLLNVSADLGRWHYNKGSGMSVRCVKD